MSFKTSTHLSQHILSHSGVKRHQCELCGFRFGRKGDLKRHLKTVHGVIPDAMPDPIEKGPDQPVLLVNLQTVHNVNQESAVGKYPEQTVVNQVEEVRGEDNTTNCETGHQIPTIVVRSCKQKQKYSCRVGGCVVVKGSREELYEHIRSDHPVKKHQCNECPMSFHNFSTQRQDKFQSRVNDCSYIQCSTLQ